MLPASLSAARDLLHREKISAGEILAEVKDRITRLDPYFHAFIHIDFENAAARARALDALPPAQRTGLLFGLPLAIKDNIDVRGMPTTCGALGAHPLAAKDADVVQSLNNEQAIIVGKNNLHEYAWGGTTENRNFGTVPNPWDRSRICHGSSGGSAAAVAAGMCYGAIGSDTGTSIRHPSAVTGLTGLRPTIGTVSTCGVFPLALTMDTVGPMALDAVDCNIIFDAMQPDSYSRNIIKPVELKHSRLGVIKDFSFSRAEPGVSEQLQEELDQLGRHGVEIVEIDLPEVQDFFLCWIILHTSEPAAVHQTLLTTDKAQYSPDVRVMLEGASNIPVADYVFAQQWRSFFIRRVLDEFDRANIDALVTPTVPNIAQVSGKAEADYVRDRVNLDKNELPFAGLASLLGFPATTMPMGFVEGMPVGMQLIGKPHADRLILGLARDYQLLTDWHTHTRDLWDRI